MRLNDMLHSILNQNTGNVSQTGTTGALTANPNIAVQIRALAPGQILQGEVQENVGDMVKLLIHMNGEDISLQARLDQNIALSAGKNLLFQVKNNGSTLSLSPLLENLAMGETAAKALDSAALPLNETTLNMTTTLMQEGLPINKDSLQGIYQEVLVNQNAELMDIVDLHKLNMPVTAENLEQIHAYKEMSHQLTAGVEQMSGELMDLVQNMSANGQGKEAVTLLQNVLQLNQDIEAAVQSNILGEAIDGTSENAALSQQTVHNSVSNMPESVTSGNNAGETIQVLTQEVQTSAEVTTSLTQQAKELLANLEGLVDDKEAFVKLVNTPNFKETMTKLLQEQMLLDPESAGSKEKVQEHFNKISKQLNTMAEALTNVAQEQSPLAKSVQNMSQNVNFLNQMNQMYAYIQLPFKLSESNAHGELYVYSNKRNLAQKEGEVSALLHLDMEHLGPVDVYVQMKEANVSTRFYLQDDEMLDFINDHIRILTERLEKRGYHMTCQMTVREGTDTEDKNVVLQELLNENSNRPALVSYSFDVRA